MVYEKDWKRVKDYADKLLFEKNVKPLEHRITRKDGSLCWVRNTPVFHYDKMGNLTSYDGIIQDITEQKKREEEKEALKEELRHAQKLEAIGTLAGGIAHDFNNILGAIMGYAELSLDDISPEASAYINLVHLLKAVHRARELIKQILAFSRQSKPGDILIDCSSIAKEVLQLFRAVLPEKIELNIDIPPGALYVFGDAAQFHQIIMNLCANGAQL